MILRKQLKPISGKYGKKKIMNQLKQDEGKKRCQFWCELKPLVIKITSVLANQTAIWLQVYSTRWGLPTLSFFHPERQVD